MGAPRPAGAMAGRTVFVVLVAVGLGLLVLKNAFDEGGSSSATPPTTTTSSTLVQSTTTTAPAVDLKTFKVIVANGSGVAGSAGKWTNSLQSLGFQMLPATNAKQGGQAATTVYYTAGADAPGAYVAEVIGATNVQPWPKDNPPVAAPGDANVIIVLGKDIATKAPPTSLPGTAPASAPADASSTPSST